MQHCISSLKKIAIILDLVLWILSRVAKFRRPYFTSFQTDCTPNQLFPSTNRLKKSPYQTFPIYFLTACGGCGNSGYACFTFLLSWKNRAYTSFYVGPNFFSINHFCSCVDICIKLTFLEKIACHEQYTIHFEQLS